MERLFIETKIGVTETGDVTGVAWPFGSPDRVGDIIEKGAFGGAAWPLPMLFGHDPNDPVGAWSKGVETADGLQVEGRLLIGKVRRADEVFALVDGGAVRGLSVGFITKKAVPRKGGGRTISSLELIEISLVTTGMHPGARVTSAKSAVQALRIAEAFNRATAALKR